MVSVLPVPSECAQLLIAPPSSTLRLGVPPSLTNPVTTPTRGPVPQTSQVTLDEPYPSPNPIQKPSRRCGYCACAAAAAQDSAASSPMTLAAYMEPSLPGDGWG